MKKNKQEIIERYIYLEKWLKNNYPSNMTDNELIDYFSSYFANKHDIMYLIDAYCLPKEEFEREMTREAKKGFYMNINALYDYFSKKYSISKDKVHERINQLIDMNKIQKKLIKTKINSYEKVSDIIDMHIKKYSKDELDRKVILEKWLRENHDKSSEKMVNYIYLLFNEEDAKYLTKAYFMPMDEIVSLIKRYDLDNPALYEMVVQKMMHDYETDRETIIERMEDAVMVNYSIMQEKEHKCNNRGKKRTRKIKNSCIN